MTWSRTRGALNDSWGGGPEFREGFLEGMTIQLGLEDRRDTDTQIAFSVLLRSPEVPFRDPCRCAHIYLWSPCPLDLNVVHRAV